MYLAIDIGGTNIRIASLDEKENIISNKISFSVEKEFESGMSKIIEETNKIADGRKIEGIGIAALGTVNANLGVIEDSANLSSWNNKPIKNYLEGKLHTRVEIENDVLVAGLGEKMFGYGKDIEEFLFIILGTGFGGAIISERTSYSLDLGHQILVWNGELCNCKQKGCAEVYVGGKNAQRIYGAQFSDKTSNEVWDEVSQKVGHALINTINHLPVPLIVFGGGVISKQPHLIERTRKIVKENMTTYPVPEMKLSRLGEDAGLYGGFALIRKNLNDNKK